MSAFQQKGRNQDICDFSSKYKVISKVYPIFMKKKKKLKKKMLEKN